jgi:hypothetical protein
MSSESKYCGECGMELTEGTGFCGECGTATAAFQNMQSKTAEPSSKAEHNQENSSSQARQDTSTEKDGLWRQLTAGKTKWLAIVFLLLLLVTIFTGGASLLMASSMLIIAIIVVGRTVWIITESVKMA